MGNGIGLSTDIALSEESLKGSFNLTNPNFRNSDKLIYFSAEASETDRLKAFGYKTNKTGIGLEQNLNTWISLA